MLDRRRAQPHLLVLRKRPHALAPPVAVRNVGAEVLHQSAVEIAVVVVAVHRPDLTPLLEVRLAACLSGLLTGTGKDGKEDGGEDRDDVAAEKG